jgi:hypothetical protein
MQKKLQTELAKGDQVSKTGLLSLLRRGMWGFDPTEGYIYFDSLGFHIHEKEQKAHMMLFTRWTIASSAENYQLFWNNLLLLCQYSAKDFRSFI